MSKQYMAVRITPTNLSLIKIYDKHITDAYFEAWMNHCHDAVKNHKRVYLLRCKDYELDTTNYDVIYEDEFVRRWEFDKGAAVNAFAAVTMKRRTVAEI